MSPEGVSRAGLPRAIRANGYHGTSEEAAAIILSRGFQLSANSYDWLGDGIYFWQDAPATELMFKLRCVNQP